MALKPTLILDEDRKVCMQLRLGPFTATAPLPEEMSTYTEAQLRPFFDRVVPEMTKVLLEMRRSDSRRMRKKLAQ